LPSDRPIEMAEVALDLLVAEEVVREGAAAREQLLGQLAEQHAAVGETFAGLALGHRVEGAHARGREEEQVARAAAIDDEGIAVAGAGLRQGDDWIAARARVPR